MFDFARRSRTAASFRQRSPPKRVLSLPSSPEQPSSSASSGRSDFHPHQQPSTPQSTAQEPFAPPPIGAECLAVLHINYPWEDYPDDTTGTVIEHLPEEHLVKIRTAKGDIITTAPDRVITQDDLVKLVNPSTFSDMLE